MQDPVEQSLAGVGGTLSGTVGLVVYSHNRHGPYSYPKPARVDPNTPYQQTQRQAFRAATQTWTFHGHPQWIRDQWDTYAASLVEISRVGRRYHPTGFNRFVAAIAFKSTLGVGFNLFAPTVFTKGRLRAPTYVHPPIGNYYTRVRVNYAAGDPWLTQSGGVFALYCSRPQPPTVNHFTGPFRFAGPRYGEPFNPPTFGVFALPFTATPGSFVWFRAKAAEEDNRISPALIGRLWFV